MHHAFADLMPQVCAGGMARGIACGGRSCDVPRNNPGDCLVGMCSVGEGQGRVIRSSIHGTTILYMDVADQPYTPRALRWQS